MLAMFVLGLAIFALPRYSVAQEAQVRVIVTRADRPLQSDAEKTVSVQLNRLVKVRVDSAVATELLETRGLVRSSQGIVVADAEAADELARSAVNLSGVSEADLLVMTDGVVRLAVSGEGTRLAKTAPRHSGKASLARID